MLKAATKQGYQVDIDLITKNNEYYQHQLQLCKCFQCECGECRCNQPSLKLDLPSNRAKYRSMTPTSNAKYNLSLNKSYYETSESSYREMNKLPQQFYTSNHLNYRGSQSNDKSRPISIDVADKLDQTMQGITQYKANFPSWKQEKIEYFKQPREMHTGPIKLRCFNTSYQHHYKQLKGKRNEMATPRLSSLAPRGGHAFEKSMYQTMFAKINMPSPVFVSKQRKLEEQQASLQLSGLQSKGESISHQTYIKQTMFMCPAKWKQGVRIT